MSEGQGIVLERVRRVTNWRILVLGLLAMLGVGATIGTGVFFVMHEAVPLAGPAVIVAFLVAALAAGLSAVCYAEMASAVPVSGSTYSYAYATLGEIVAIGVAACLVSRRCSCGRRREGSASPTDARSTTPGCSSSATVRPSRRSVRTGPGATRSARSSPTRRRSPPPDRAGPSRPDRGERVPCHDGPVASRRPGGLA